MAAQDEIPGLGARSDRPRLNTAADLGQHRLSPTEGFVLSRVDGQSSYDDICRMSGLGREQTLEILRGLKQAKLILGPSERAAGVRVPLRPATPASGVAADNSPGIPVPPPQSDRRPAEPAPRPSTAPAPSVQGASEKDRHPAAAPARTRGVGPLERLDDGTPVEAGELKDWPEADPLLKERIVRLHRRLKTLSAVELLGLSPQAEAGAIRRAFAMASKELHPDRYFGKNLGSFKAKLAAIFARLTEAMQEIEGEQKRKR